MFFVLSEGATPCVTPSNTFIHSAGRQREKKPVLKTSTQIMKTVACKNARELTSARKTSHKHNNKDLDRLTVTHLACEYNYTRYIKWYTKWYILELILR